MKLYSFDIVKDCWILVEAALYKFGIIIIIIVIVIVIIIMIIIIIIIFVCGKHKVNLK